MPIQIHGTPAPKFHFSNRLTPLETMKKIFLSALAMAALMFVGCTNDLTNSEIGGAGNVGKVMTSTLTASISDMTRTSLTPGASGTSASTVWSEGDVIGVITADGTIRQGVLTSGAGKTTAGFAITGEEGDVYTYAFYPYIYNGNEKCAAREVNGTADTGSLKLSFPSVQTYKAGSVFAESTNTMAGQVADGKVTFQSVMGAIEIRVKGSQLVEGITLKVADYKKKMSGIGTLDLSNMEPSFESDNTAYSFIDLEVPGGVQLNTATATSFYIVLPAGEYPNLSLGFKTKDGSYSRTATSTHTVNTREILPLDLGNLDELIDKSTAINLSATESANCYIVIADGSEKTYSFDIKRVDGTVPSNQYLYDRYVSADSSVYPEHTTADQLEPNFAHILWAEDLKIAYNVHFDKAAGKIYFKHDGSAIGNARIMLMMNPMASHTLADGILRCDNAMLWGWHIWACKEAPGTTITTTPYTTKDTNSDGNISREEIIAYSQTTTIGWMDRNLGATWTPTTVTEVTEMTEQQATDALGLYFQGGNLHPYPRPLKFGVGGSANHSWDQWQRAVYQYGFTQYAQSWTASSDIKNTLDENWQFPYYRYSANYVPTTPGDAYSGSTSRTSWIKMDFRLGGTASDTPVVLWGGNKEKQNYDPCPPGWRVAHQGNMYQTMQGENFKNYLETGADAATAATQRTFQVTPDLKYNSRFVGTYITYNNKDVDFYPGGGYMSTGKITFNASGNIGYYWGSPYQANSATLFNTGIKGCFQDDVSKSNYASWPQPGTPYQLRCVKK